jgi:hypothetical protein
MGFCDDPTGLPSTLSVSWPPSPTLMSNPGHLGAYDGPDMMHARGGSYKDSLPRVAEKVLYHHILFSTAVRHLKSAVCKVHFELKSLVTIST